MTQAEALAELTRRCAPDRPPVIDSDTLLSFLKASRRRFGQYRPDSIQPWAPGETVTVGMLRKPTRYNGHFYTVTGGGATGASEPGWLLDTGAAVSDSGATWAEAGLVYWVPNWDLNLAAALAWEYKITQVSHLYSISDTGQTLNRDQLIEHFERNAKRYRGKRAGNVHTVNRVVYQSVYPNAGIVYIDG
jgi:hypothetical protein